MKAEMYIGVSVEVNTRILRGSQQIPFIFDDHASNDRWLSAFKYMYDMPSLERRKMGLLAAESVRKRFPIDRNDFKVG
jgi:hypothetical protein